MVRALETVQYQETVYGCIKPNTVTMTYHHDAMHSENQQVLWRGIPAHMWRAGIFRTLIAVELFVKVSQQLDWFNTSSPLRRLAFPVS